MSFRVTGIIEWMAWRTTYAKIVQDALTNGIDPNVAWDVWRNTKSSWIDENGIMHTVQFYNDDIPAEVESVITATHGTFKEIKGVEENIEDIVLPIQTDGKPLEFEQIMINGVLYDRYVDPARVWYDNDGKEQIDPPIRTTIKETTATPEQMEHLPYPEAGTVKTDPTIYNSKDEAEVKLTEEKTSIVEATSSKNNFTTTEATMEAPIDTAYGGSAPIIAPGNPTLDEVVDHWAGPPEGQDTLFDPISPGDVTDWDVRDTNIDDGTSDNNNNGGGQGDQNNNTQAPVTIGGIKLDKKTLLIGALLLIVFMSKK